MLSNWLLKAFPELDELFLGKHSMVDTSLYILIVSIGLLIYCSEPIVPIFEFCFLLIFQVSNDTAKPLATAHALT